MQSGLCSERGARPQNEDFVAVLAPTSAQKLVVAAVADGVGGRSGGRVAAELIVRGFIEGVVGQAGRGSFKTAALRSVEATNSWLHAIGRTDPELEGMSSTFTGFVCSGRQAFVTHVGDSRLYRLRGDHLERLTTDHVLSPGQRNVLTRAIGAEESVRLDAIEVQNEVHDRFLFCTDGVHAGLDDGALREILGRRRDPDETAREIVERALETAVGDNATALVIDIVSLPTANFAEIKTALERNVIAALPSAGRMIDGFSLDQVLSDSRYVRVFRATDTLEDREVVLKFPKALVGSDRIVKGAFLRETWLASKIRNQYVGEVLQLNADRQTQLYLAFPFYDGETLESRLKRSPQLSLATGLDIARKLAKGLAAIHRAGVIHRDVKPDNVILLAPKQGQEAGLKLVDFGVARDKRSDALEEASGPGTPSFMAPELFSGAAADEKSDQFALGVTIYRLFTRQYPYGEIEPFSHPKFGAPTPLTAHRPDLPAWLDRAVLRAVAIDPEQRHADVLELMFELEHGADRAAPILVQQKSLYQRNPLRFWQIVAALLTILLFASNLYQAHRHRADGPEGGQPIEHTHGAK